MDEIELTDEQIERQDFVDNVIFSMLQKFSPDIQWDIEVIGMVRDSVAQALEIPNEIFYP